MGRLYGDSSPFPWDVDYLELVRAAVRCGVGLLVAQQAIDEASAKIAAAEQTRASEKGRLDRISEALRQTMLRFENGPEREARVAARVKESARSAVEEELAGVLGVAEAELAARRAEIDRAREAALRALEEFLRHHLVPGSETRVLLRADGEAYAGEATLTTPFGVDATFRLDIPQADEWGRVRRVSELSAGSEIHVPQQAGWISKRLELQRVKLDKLFVTELHGGPTSGRLQVRKSARGGAGYAIETGRTDAHASTNGSSSAWVRELDGASSEEAESHVVEPDDRECVDRLFAAVDASLAPLAARRATLVTATFDGRPVRDLDTPRMIAMRLVQALAPTVKEIERRSGSGDELVLRRDVADGRREEKYVRKSELIESLMVLPAPLRAVFDPLPLAPRGSLTPPPPTAEVDEISMELVEDESSARRVR